MNKITPEEIQNIVCEEILREEVLQKYPSINIDLKWMIFAAMKRYAGRKVAEKDAELKTLTAKCASLLTTISEQQDQLQQKDTKLREVLMTVRTGLLNTFGLFGGGHKLNDIFDYMNKTLGDENT